MRVHISLDDEVVVELDRRVGPRGRSPFLEKLLRVALDDATRWDEIESALGTVADTGHDWDADPAAWVSRQRSGDARRSG